MLCICRLQNVSDHNRHRTCIHNCLPYFSIGSIIFFYRQTVDGCQQMLVSFIHTITGEMLCCRFHSIGFESFQLLQCIGNDFLLIRTKGTHIHDGISPVHIQVADWRKGPVTAYGFCFLSCDIAKTPCIFLMIRSRHAHGTGKICTVSAYAISS